MRRTEILPGVRKMRFAEVYGDWESSKLTQREAAVLLGVCERTFRRYVCRYEDAGLAGLSDQRLEQVSHRKAPEQEVMEVRASYRSRHLGWSAKHFYSWCRKDGGKRSYSWVKTRLQEASLVGKEQARGAHRKRRDPAALPGMLVHY